jgi:serine/threonine protein kinase
MVGGILLEEQEQYIMLWVFIFHCRFYLVFEKVNGGPLLTRLQEQIHFTEREASQIIRDLASALQFLHVKGEFIRLRLYFTASHSGIEDPLANRTHQTGKFMDKMNLCCYITVFILEILKNFYSSYKLYLQTASSPVFFCLF